METLSPMTRNLISLVKDIPVIVLKASLGRKDSGRILEEIRSLDGRGFRVFQNGDDLCIVADGSGRTFLI